MTNEEAIEIIQNVYKCVDCERPVMVQSKELLLKAYEMAIKALSQEPCDDAISRETVIDTLQYAWEANKDIQESIVEIKALPSVTPSRRKGHWLKTGQSFLNPNKFRNFCCTECSHELDEHIRKEPKYCPNCGAKMVEPQEREDKE